MAEVDVEEPRAPPLGPDEQPAVSAGPPLQLPGAVPLLGSALVPGGAQRKGPSVGGGNYGCWALLPYTPQHMGGGHGFRDMQGVLKKKKTELSQRCTETEIEKTGDTETRTRE